ncbi:MAG: N-acetylmuramoyl-L-alanine amidase [Chitinophagaceae bacterium]
MLFFSFTEEKKQKAVKTIIIDAGHGGKDQGAAGLISTEAQICLEISKELGKEIEKRNPGIKILYTRTTDIIPGNMPDKNKGNRYRADFANSSRADLFISIHCNSAGKAPGGWYEKRIVDYNYKTSYVGKGKKKKKVTRKIPVYQSFYVENKAAGTETYIWTAKENSHKTEMVNTEFSGEDDSDIIVPENDPAINALKLIYTKKYFQNSLKFADLVQQEFQNSGRINRGVKQRNEKGIWVLHATGMPSVLVEIGFISNKEEEEYLNSEKGQKEIVDDIASGVDRYINSLAKPQQALDTLTTGSLKK